MYQLIESIKVVSHQLHNLSYHQKRMQKSSKEVFGQQTSAVNFEEIQMKALKLKDKAVYKLRIEYNLEEFSYEFIPYKVRTINSLKLIEDNNLDYSHKYKDRNTLFEHFENRNGCDDILITQNGSITDTYYCNVALKKNGQWFTPDMPLLKGTKRQYLLDQLIITEKEIFVEDIPDFNEICLFNSMLDFGQMKFTTHNIEI